MPSYHLQPKYHTDPHDVEITYDPVTGIPSYSKHGVHKGMQGWICLYDLVNGTWLVNFPQCGEKADIAEISVKEEDLKVIPVMYAAVNEEIKARFEEAEKNEKSISEKLDELSDYMI